MFGRVTPQQKRAMVGALQSQGHVVAMTGDGVNDALALKDADIGVAMGSGAAATRAVAQLVLLDGKFATLPGVVAEGRRVIANIERVGEPVRDQDRLRGHPVVASTVFSVPYPFLPRHLTIVRRLTIGIPAFFLALAPNTRRYRPGFLRRVLGFSVPAGVLLGVGVFLAYAIARGRGSTGRRGPHRGVVARWCRGSGSWCCWPNRCAGGSWPWWPPWAVLFVLALIVPGPRDFFALSLPLGAFAELGSASGPPRRPPSPCSTARWCAAWHAGTATPRRRRRHSVPGCVESWRPSWRPAIVGALR